jgi:hypothetical protein
MGLESLAEMRGLDLEVWIVSAGYGLVRPSAQLKPYSAAFSPGQPDSIAPRLDGSARDQALREWWKTLSEWPGPTGGNRTLAAVAGAGRSDPMLVVLSAPYLSALNDDLTVARESLSDPHLLQVVSAGTRSAPGITDNLLPVSGRLRHAVGGPLVSLNVRLARWIINRLEEHSFNFERLRSLLVNLDSSAVPLARRSRHRLSDAEVVTLARQLMKADAAATRTALLRELRSQGLACEQARFGRLFEMAAGR